MVNNENFTKHIIKIEKALNLRQMSNLTNQDCIPRFSYCYSKSKNLKIKKRFKNILFGRAVLLKLTTVI